MYVLQHQEQHNLYSKFVGWLHEFFFFFPLISVKDHPVVKSSTLIFSLIASISFRHVQTISISSLSFFTYVKHTYMNGVYLKCNCVQAKYSNLMHLFIKSNHQEKGGHLLLQIKSTTRGPNNAIKFTHLSKLQIHLNCITSLKYV